MRTWQETFKPRASSRMQLFLAAAMWTCVGGMLLLFGARWVTESRPLPAALPLLLLGVGIGVAKSRLVLDRTAEKIVDRISRRGEGRCIGGFLSLRSWLLVLAMVALGRLLRTGILPLSVAGVLYAAIGTGLVFSSRLAWRAWKPAAPGS